MVLSTSFEICSLAIIIGSNLLANQVKFIVFIYAGLIQLCLSLQVFTKNVLLSRIRETYIRHEQPALKYIATTFSFN
jgi:hypothetical protein